MWLMRGSHFVNPDPHTKKKENFASCTLTDNIKHQTVKELRKSGSGYQRRDYLHHFHTKIVSWPIIF